MRRRLAALGAAMVLAAAPSAWAASEPANIPELPYRYDSKGRRDPFVSLVRDGRLVASTAGPQVSESKPVLYGILWDPSGRSIALINDTEARVGDIIGEYKVKEIQQNQVVLDRGGEPVVLTIVFDTPGPKSTSTPTGGHR